VKPPKETTDSPIQQKWWANPGLVYFFAAGRPPVAIKIGVASVSSTLSQAIRSRQRSLQTSNHELIELLGIIQFSEGGYPTRQAEVLERELHLRFAASQRFKQHACGAEWFKPTNDILTYIEGNAVPPEALNLPRWVSMLAVEDMAR
jgi:hypothetical protein